jgi:Lambda phage tail tape-measure protein (Tape_meas_lam_C)
MADISVTLTLDDSQYQTILKRVDANTQAFGTKFTKTVNDLNTSIKALTAVIGDLGTKFDELSKKIDANTQSMTASANKMSDGLKGTNDLSSGIQTLSGHFTTLASAIVGASLTSFISNAISAAATTVRMSEALGISTQAFLTLSAGAVAAGKDQDSLGRAMLRMEATAQQANDGSQRLKSAYAALGISMDDLHKLSPEETFLKIARALATMEDPGKRAELTMMLLGRDAKTIDWKAFVAGAEASVDKMKQHAQSTEDAARAYRAIQSGLQELKRNILDLLDPLLKLIGNNAEGLLGAKVAAEALLAILSVSTIVGIAKAFTVLSEAVAALGISLSGVTALVTGGGLAKLGTMFAAAGEYISEALALLRSFVAIEATIGAIAATIEAPFEVVAAAIAAVVAVVVAAGVAIFKAFGPELTDKIKAGWQALTKTISSITDSLKNAFTSFGEWFDKTTDTWANKIRSVFGLIPLEARRAQDELNAQLEKDKTNIQNKGNTPTTTPLLTTPEYKPELAQAEAARNRIQLMQMENNLAVDRLQKEIELVTKTEDVRKAQMAQFDATRRALIEEERIRGQIRVLTLENKNPNALGAKDAEIAALQKELGMYNSQAAAISEKTQALIQAQTTRKFGLEFEKEDADLQAKIKELTEQAAQVGQNATENNIAALEKQKEVTMAAWAEKQKLYGTGDLNEFRKGLQQIIDDYNQLEDAQRKLNDAKAAFAEKKLFKEEDTKVGKELINIQAQIAELTMTANEKSTANIVKKRDEETVALQTQLELIKGRKLDETEVNKLLTDQANRYAPLITAQQQLNDKSRSFDVGFTEAWKSYAENATNAATAAKDAFGAVTKNMDTMLADFVKTGKLNFGDFAKSVIQDLELIALKMAAANVFKAVGAASGFSLAGIASFLGFAEGGVIPNNQPVLVGENGPEIITGVGGRTVIPNSQLTSAMSNTGGDQYVTHNYNINAVDAKSVAQLFYENRMTMFGMTEQARRELPMRNR